MKNLICLKPLSAMSAARWVSRCDMVFIFCCVLLSACTEQTIDTKRLERFPVKVTPIKKQTLEENLTLVGSIKALDEATLFSRVPGKILKNMVKEGDRIRKGSAVALVERDEVGVKFEPAPVPSTLTGLVARVYLDRGANVTLSTPIALIVDQRRVFIRADIPERYTGRVKMGQPCQITVDAYPDKTFIGRVSRLSPVVDMSTRSTYMEASVGNQEGLLRSGMFAKLSIVLDRREDAMAVSRDAVTFKDGQASVFVVDGDKAVTRNIKVGMETDGLIEVQDGLNAEDPVITFGLMGLQEGSLVEVLP